MNGIRDFIKEDPQSSLLPSASWERDVKLAVHEPGSGSLPDMELASVYMVGLPCHQNCEK